MMASFFKQAPFGFTVLLLMLVVFAAAIAFPLNRKLLLVKSDSMKPHISSGDLVVLSTADHLFGKGDIIAFKNTKEGNSIVTRRIVEVVDKNSKVYLERENLGSQARSEGRISRERKYPGLQPEEVYYRTKGDFSTVDSFLVPNSSVVGKAGYSIKGVGTTINFWPQLLMAAWVFAFIFVLRKVLQNYRPVKKVNTKPMGLPHASVSFESLFELLARKLKGRGNFAEQFSFSSEGLRFESKLSRP